MCHFCVHFFDFRLWCYLQDQEVLCEIQNIFSWQTIRDLAKKILAPRNPKLARQKLKFQKIAYFSHIIAVIVSVLCNSFDFWLWCYLQDQDLLGEIQNIFSWQTIWDLSKKILALRNPQVFWLNHRKSIIKYNRHIVSSFCHFVYISLIFDFDEKNTKRDLDTHTHNGAFVVIVFLLKSEMILLVFCKL